MTKVTLTNPTTYVADASAVAQQTNNNAAITAAVENTLSRDGTGPNSMNAAIDMNGFNLLNLPKPVLPTDVVRLQDLKVTGVGLPASIGVTLDGGGGVTVPTGYQLSLPVPFACTITAVTILADAVGTIVFDIKKAAIGGFPTATSIVAAAPPTLTASQSVKNTTLTGWTISLLQGDILEFWVTSSSVVSKVTISLDVIR